MAQVQASEFVLPGAGRKRQAAVIQQPFVERAVILELERAKRVSDAFQRVAQGVSEVVHGVDAPVTAGERMRHVTDPVEHGVAQVDVGRRHVDARAQDLFAVAEIAGPHAPEQGEVFLYGTAAVGAGTAGAGQGATVGGNLFGGTAVDEGMPVLDHVLGDFIQAREIVGRVSHQRCVETQPVDVAADGVDKLLLLCNRVGVVIAQIAGAAVFGGHAEVQADGLGVTNVQKAVRLRRKPRHYARVPAGLKIVGNDPPNEILSRHAGGVRRRGGSR